MKYLGISGGWIIEGFCILPSISINWMKSLEKTNHYCVLDKYNTYYDIQFAWLFWYITIGQIKKKLKEQGY